MHNIMHTSTHVLQTHINTLTYSCDAITNEHNILAHRRTLTSARTHTHFYNEVVCALVDSGHIAFASRAFVHIVTT